jgi:hypothetical protein
MDQDSVVGLSESAERVPRYQVLVEAPAPWNGAVKEAALVSGGAVLFCGGPKSLHDGECPLVAGKSCAYVDAADVVVHHLDLNRAENREVLAALRREHPQRPVVAMVWRADTARHGDLLDGCEVVEFPWTVPKLRAALDAAAARLPRSPGPGGPLVATPVS